MRLVDAQVHSGGDNPATLPNTDPPPSVYLPTTFPLVAAVAWLPWKAARLTWSLLSILAFGFSAALLIRCSNLETSQRWLLAAGILLFSPTSSGLSTGNPSVLSCSLTLAAVLLALRNRVLPAALLLGIAHSLKPQISVAAVAVLALWECWRTVAVSILVPALAAIISFFRIANVDQYRFWLGTLQSGIQSASLPGGINDPSPANYFSYHLINAAAIGSIWIRDPQILSLLIWTLAATLTGGYLWLRRLMLSGNRPLHDIAFFCTVSLVPVYHRYYDAQLLLGMLPFLFGREGRKRRPAGAIWVGLALLVFPLQAIVAESHQQLNPGTPIGFLLLRHQPAIVLLFCFCLLPWWGRTGLRGNGHGTGPDATVCNS